MMKPDRSSLSKVLESANVRIEPFAAHHVEPLRTACAEDQEIWKIYPVNMIGEDFDKAMAAFHSLENWVRFALVDLKQDRLVGTSNYINPDAFGVVEIGGTYIAPSVRGTGYNKVMKTLMIDHAYACGFTKIEFRVDTRNERSMAAVLKLGTKQEGVLRQNRVTWTGYRRDTAVFGLLQSEWAG